MSLPRLRILSGAGQGQVVDITSAPLALGRARDNAVIINDPRASRHHARILHDHDGIVIERLSANSHLYINGDSVERAVLTVGDTVLIADTALVLEDDQREDSSNAISGLVARVGSPAGTTRLLDAVLAIQEQLASDDPRLLENALQRLSEALPVSRLGLFSVEIGGGVAQGPTVVRGHGSRGMSHSLAARVAASGQPLCISSSLDADMGRTADEQSVQAVLGAPIVATGQVVAVLLADNREAPGRLGAGHLPLLQFSARALGAVFERRELAEMRDERTRSDAESASARQVQAHLFTKDPRKIPGAWRWAALYRPSLDLGGDYFDFHHAGGITTWVVADVSGKGMPAALVVAMLKAHCRSLLATVPGPAQLLMEIDHRLRGEVPAMMFLTAIAVRLHADGRLEWAGVGHPPAILVHRDGASEELASQPGMLAASMLPRRQVHAKETRLVPGDRLLLCTDGAIEASNASGDQFGTPRLAATLAATAGNDPASIISAMLEVIVAHRGARRLDDDVILALAM